MYPGVAGAGVRPPARPPQEGPDWGKCTWWGSDKWCHPGPLAASPKRKKNLHSQVRQHQSTTPPTGWRKLARELDFTWQRQGSSGGENSLGRTWGSHAAGETWGEEGVGADSAGRLPGRRCFPSMPGKRAGGHTPGSGSTCPKGPCWLAQEESLGSLKEHEGTLQPDWEEDSAAAETQQAETPWDARETCDPEWRTNLTYHPDKWSQMAGCFQVTHQLGDGGHREKEYPRQREY